MSNVLDLLDGLIQFRVKWKDNPLYPEDIKSSVQRVPIRKIISHQNAVKEHIVEEYKKHPGRDLPMLHKEGKKYIVEDGNHRIVAKKEKGEKFVRARVFEKTLAALDSLIEFKISIGTAKRVLGSVRNEYPGLELTRNLERGGSSYNYPLSHSLVVAKGPQRAMPFMSPLETSMHEHGHISPGVTPEEIATREKVGHGATGEFPAESISEEYRANRDILERVKQYGTPEEVQDWKNIAQKQIKEGYRKPYWNSLRYWNSPDNPESISAGKLALQKNPWLRRQQLSAKLDDLINFASRLHQPAKQDEPPGQLPTFKEGELLDYTTQRHEAKRAGLHRDVRIGSSKHGLLSWATRKDLPEPGKKIGIHQQSTHPHSYLGWEGEIPSGYGAGKVSTEHLGKALVTHSSPDELHATLASKRGNQRVAFIRHPKGWLLARAKHPEAPPEAQKPKMKSLGPEKSREQVLKRLTQEVEKGAIVQPKVDGALAYIKVGPRPEIISHRTSKTTGSNVVQTERFYHGRPTLDIPKEHHGKTLLAEIFGTRNGKAIEPQELGGILNANIAESIRRQKATGVKLKAMPFDLAGDKGTYPERLEKLKEIAKHLPQIELPEEARTPEDAKKLYSQIRSGKHPLTKEGVIIHRPEDRPIKVKNIKETNVTIHSLFPGKGKYEGSHGGFYYSDKHGKPLGKVGTGFTDQTREDLHQYIGRTARVRYQERYKSGRLRAPSFIGVDESK